jgi:hypothetical protein
MHWLIGAAILLWISKRAGSSAPIATAPAPVLSPAPAEDPFWEDAGNQEDFKLTAAVPLSGVPFNTNYRIAQPFRPPKTPQQDNFVSPVGTHTFTSNYRLGLGGLGTGGVRF